MGTTTTVLDSDVLSQLHERIRAEVDAGRVPAAQLAIGLDGEVVHTATFGDADDDLRFAVFSVTKAVIAAVVWQLLAEGSLEVDTPVTDLVPSFAAAEGVTVLHLLTHTGGFPLAPLGPPAWESRESRLEQFGRWRLQYEPGTRFEYHATAGHWVLAEMIEVVEGRDFREVVRTRVLDPLGLDRFLLGGEEAATARMAELTAVGRLPTPAEIEEALGVPGIDLEALIGDLTADVFVGLNDPGARAVGIPGGGGISDAATVALLYQAFLHNPGDLWDPAVLADGTATVRCSLPDPYKQHTSNRTLGLILAGDDGMSAMRGMGHTVSPRAFGHNGAGGQIAWADPATGISVAFVTSGMDRSFITEGRRTAAIGSRAARLVAG